MSATRLRARAWIGLVAAVVSSALLSWLVLASSPASDNDATVLLLSLAAGAVLSITTGVLAAWLVIGPVTTSVQNLVAIPALAGLAAAVGCYLFVVILASWFWPPINDGVLYPNGRPYDWAPVIIAIVGAVLYLAAATLYGFAGTAQGVPVGARTGLLVLLLLAMVPVANIPGLVGLTIVTYARTSLNGRFLRVRGGSTRQY